MAPSTEPEEVRRLVRSMVDYGSDMMDLLAWNLGTLFTQPPTSDFIGHLFRDGFAIGRQGLLSYTKERPAPAIIPPLKTGEFE